MQLSSAGPEELPRRFICQGLLGVLQGTKRLGPPLTQSLGIGGIEGSVEPSVGSQEHIAFQSNLIELFLVSSSNKRGWSANTLGRISFWQNSCDEL